MSFLELATKSTHLLRSETMKIIPRLVRILIWVNLFGVALATAAETSATDAIRVAVQRMGAKPFGDRGSMEPPRSASTRSLGDGCSPVLRDAELNPGAADVLGFDGHIVRQRC